MECSFYSIDDVAQIVSVSHDWAEKIVRVMNKKMASEGYQVIKGKISKGYFWDSNYCGKSRFIRKVGILDGSRSIYNERKNSFKEWRS